jgi:hypothetical protein
MSHTFTVANCSPFPQPERRQDDSAATVLEHRVYAGERLSREDAAKLIRAVHEMEAAAAARSASADESKSS